MRAKNIDRVGLEFFDADKFLSKDALELLKGVLALILKAGIVVDRHEDGVAQEIMPGITLGGRDIQQLKRELRSVHF